VGRPPPKTACLQARLINLIGGGGGGEGKSRKGAGTEREAGKEKAGRGIPQDGGRRKKQETVTHTQHCFIFCTGKREKRRKLTKMGQEQGLKGTGSPPSPCLPRHPNVRLNPLLPVNIVRSCHSQFLEHVLLAYKKHGLFTI